ncbi:divalent cation transporter [Croceicoccus estronivorus]|uniref:divalent-cation tolerance protein CutA n=1 Tax=Croceicoccus estronivorus TaxID=1172626 RepID=UPI00082EA6D7|nr:divalent cation tolerance protein CutA [Croceicoccus estronivorus]OCC23973.1 divalent cation transporter [Croceicoccus estronivorus]
MSESGLALIWSPFADDASAEAAAAQLLDEQLVACVNILPAIRSLYIWNGERSSGTECGALFKTDAALLDAAVARLAEIHPYEVPAITGWRCDAAAVETVNWIGALAPPDRP